MTGRGRGVEKYRLERVVTGEVVTGEVVTGRGSDRER